MALTYKKLSELTDMNSSQIDSTTKLVVTTGSTKVNNNLKVTDLIVDDLVTNNQYRALSAKQGKKLYDEKAPILNPSFQGTVSGITKAMIPGLSNVDNTSDVNKPISTATQSALNLKASISSLNLKKDILLPIRVDGASFSIADAESVVYMATNGATFILDVTHTPVVGTKIIIKNGNIAGCLISGTSVIIDGVDRDFDSGTPLALNTAYNSITLLYTGSTYGWITI